MNKRIIISIIIAILVVVIAVIAKNNGQQSDINSVDKLASENSDAIHAEKIEVVHFHGTRQCWSCVTVGEYALKTIQDKFPEEYKNGTIVFMDINIELPENEDIVVKYQASGSSFFVNIIIDGHDNIEEDTTVWQLVGDESKYINYFENKLKNLLSE